MKELKTEILIIGGGPAGSTTALYLSKLGFDITLIEKKVFPRETLCGEFLSNEVTDVLKELKVYDDFILLNPNKVCSFKAIDYSGIELRSAFYFDAYAMKRSVFDSLLLEKAKTRNVNVIQPAEAVSIAKVNSEFISAVDDGSGELINIKSNLVIAAYGKQNILDKNMQRGFVKKRSNLNGVKFHLPVSLLKESFFDEIRIYTDEDLYFGMNSVSNTEITVCFLENRKESKIPAREKLINVIRSNKHFQKVFSEEAINYLKSADIYGAGNIYFGKRELIKNGIIMIGDAARVISPLAGNGIGMAMESARLLYVILKEYKFDEMNRGKIYLSYQRKFEEIFKRRLRTAKLIQGIILNNKLCKTGYSIVQRYPSLMPYLIKFTRSYNSA